MQKECQFHWDSFIAASTFAQQVNYYCFFKWYFSSAQNISERIHLIDSSSGGSDVNWNNRNTCHEENTASWTVHQPTKPQVINGQMMCSDTLSSLVLPSAGAPIARSFVHTKVLHRQQTDNEQIHQRLQQRTGGWSNGIHPAFDRYTHTQTHAYEVRFT